MDKLEIACTNLVEAIKEKYPTWIGSAQFSGTPIRLRRMYEDFCWSESKIKEEVNKQFRVFESGYDEMLTQGPIKVWTLCPHHLLPCLFSVVIGYVPKGGHVIGLSKFARISEVLGKRPIMQEEYSTELARVLESGLEPRGVGVIIEGTHGCMTCRGVKQDSKVLTSSLKGCILKEASCRNEFLTLAGRRL